MGKCPVRFVILRVQGLWIPLSRIANKKSYAIAAPAVGSMFIGFLEQNNNPGAILLEMRKF